ncbi:MAG: hypothetical protein IJW62_02205 [Clostridia bacterium]|nr:hypothetical protein [Clostridia bacterium]
MKKLLSILLVVVFAISLLPVSVFAAETVRYEAEDAVITSGDIRNAGGDHAASVSGGKFVGGYDNIPEAVTFTVTATNSGDYLMTIGYISMDLRAFRINVNGTVTENYAFTETGRSWDGDTKTYTMEIKLNQGENTIIFGSNGNAPSIDFIDLKEITCEHPTTEIVGVKEAALNDPGYTGDKTCTVCGMVLEQGTKTYVIPENRYEAEKAVITAGEIRQAHGDYANSVSNGLFVGGFDGMTDAVTFTVNVPKAGKYVMIIGYISMDSRSYDITVNGAKTEDYVATETGNAWEGDTKTYTMDITLNAGDNTISFGQNDGKPVPNLDYIQIEAIPCDHANTKVEGAKDATQDAEGYTGDTVCSDCGETIAEGEVIPKLPATVEPPKTGDAMIVISAFALVAAAGTVMIARKRKIEE